MRQFIHINQMEDDQNRELQKKFKKKDSFYKQMAVIAKKYSQFQQQALYCVLSGIRQDMIQKLNVEISIFKKGVINVEYFIVYGFIQPKGDKSFEKLILQIVKKIPKPTRPYGIVYINTLAESGAYSDFKKILQILPIEYYINLTHIYIFQGSFRSKASNFLSFGTISSFLKNKTIYTNTLEILSEKSQIKYETLVSSMNQKILNELSKQEMKITKIQNDLKNSKPAIGSAITSSTYHDKCQKQQFLEYKQDYQSSFNQTEASKIVFRSNLRLVQTRQPPNKEKRQKGSKFQIDQYETGSTGAPLVVELLIYYFDNNQNALNLQGLFRKSVSIDDEIQIIKNLQNRNYDYLDNVSDPHLIANALKRFLSNFKTPIIPYDTFNLFMEKDNDPNFATIVVQQIKKLSKIRKMTIFVVFDFLRTRVVPCSQKNKMNQNNMCIVMGPCLMSSEVSSFKDLIYAAKIIKVANIIFKQFELIFGNKRQQHQLLRRSYKLHVRESIKNRLSGDHCKEENNFEVIKQTVNENQEVQMKGKIKLLHKATLYVQKKLELESQSEDEQKLDNNCEVEIEVNKKKQQQNLKHAEIEMKWDEL